MSAAPGQRALVTGATGFLGLHLVEALRSSGWQVSALCRAASDTTTLRSLGVRIFNGDILDRSSVDAALTPDVNTVFHSAADLSVWRPRDAQQTRINVQGTENIVAAALSAHRPRLIHVSTIASFGRQLEPITELTPSTAARSWINYERTKWLAEQQVRDGVTRGLPAMIVSPSAVVGPRDRSGWAKLFVDLSRGRVPFCPPGSGTFNDVRAVAAALVACATHGRPGESYLLSGETLTFTELIKMVAEELGVAAPKVTLPGAVLRTLVAIGDWQATRRGVEPQMTREMATLLCRNTLCRSRKAELELGYRPMSVRQGIRDSVRWLRQAGLLTSPSP